MEMERMEERKTQMPGETRRAHISSVDLTNQERAMKARKPRRIARVRSSLRKSFACARFFRSRVRGGMG